MMSAPTTNQEVTLSRTLRSCLLTLAATLSLTPLYAITYIVPQDRDLVHRADAIAVVTAGESHAEVTPDGRYVTVVSLTVGERIKGDLAPDAIQLVEPGGIVGDRGTIIPGSPRYEAGKSYLVFLLKTKQGAWATYGLQLGQFELTIDINGAPIATRMGQEREVFGFNEGDWSPHTEKLRDARAFLNFVRGEAAEVGSQSAQSYLREPAETVVLQFPEFRPRANFTIHETATRADYLLSGNFRWQNPTANFHYCCAPTFQPAPLDGPGASSAAVSNWNGAGAGINYSLGTVNTAKAIGPPGDGQNTIVFNDANGELAGAFPGAAAYGQITVGSGSYSNLGDGITYIAIQEVDVVVAKNLNTSQATFVGVMTHELGHTLGFRHSDQNGSGSACGAPLICTTDAVMNSTVAFGLQSLRPYDQGAATTVYGSGPPPCVGPSITGQPTASQTISAGSSTTLSVVAAGTGITYQWYIGNPGNTSNPIPGATSSSVSVSPSTTTTYFVRVTGQCAPTTVDSTAAVVNVTCQNPAITQQPVGSSVSAGTSAQLTVGATGSSLTYQWFSGATAANATPSTGTAVPSSNSPSIFVSPTSTTFYSVRVSGTCGTPQISAVVQVTVTAAGCPAVNAPTPASSGGPTTYTLSASPSTGSGASITTVAWFTAGGGTSPFATGSSVSVTPSGSVTYFYQATNSCGNASNSGTIVLTGPSCSVTASANGPSSVIAGANFTLTSNATGTGLSYQWYIVAPDGTASAISGAVSPNLTTSITSNTKYLVKVSASCGNSTNSNTVTVNLNTGQCSAGTDLCVDGLRYKISLMARDPSGKTAQGKALYQTDVFGYFSLAEFTGNPGNPEVFIKVLGPTSKGVPVIFYSGLTNLDYTITVNDLQTGQLFKAYHVTPPPGGSFISKGDFDFEGNVSTACADITVTKSQESPGSCGTDASTLCLLNRFRVTMTAHDDPARTGKTVSGQTIPKNTDFGFFSTPGLSNDPSNVEAFVKAINATSFDGHYWIFLGGLTDVEYTIKVVDTTTGKANTYFKPLHSTCGLNDVNAFNAP